MSTTSIHDYVLELHLEITLKTCSVIGLLFSIGHLYLIAVLFSEDKRTNTINIERDWTTFLYFSDNSTLNSKNIWEDPMEQSNLGFAWSKKPRQRTHSWKK